MSKEQNVALISMAEDRTHPGEVRLVMRIESPKVNELTERELALFCFIYFKRICDEMGLQAATAQSLDDLLQAIMPDPERN